MKHLFLYFSWVLMITGFSLTSVAFYKLFSNSKQRIQAQNGLNTPVIGLAADYALKIQELSKEQKIMEIADSRPQALADFINRHNPKLLEETPNLHQQLVDIADRHGLDFRLLPAIAMKESGMCKVIPENSFNCLGLGVHSKGTWLFESYSENFDTAARVLKKNYIDKGLVTPEAIMTKYTPSSPNGEWARGVNQFMSEIKYNDRHKGREARETNSVIPQSEQK